MTGVDETGPDESGSRGCLLIAASYADVAGVVQPVVETAADRVLADAAIGDFIDLRFADGGLRPGPAPAEGEPAGDAASRIADALTRPAAVDESYLALAVVDQSAATVARLLGECRAHPVLAGLPLRLRGFAATEDRPGPDGDGAPPGDVIVAPGGGWTEAALAAGLHQYAEELFRIFATTHQPGVSAAELVGIRRREGLADPVAPLPGAAAGEALLNLRPAATEPGPDEVPSLPEAAGDGPAPRADLPPLPPPRTIDPPPADPPPAEPAVAEPLPAEPPPARHILARRLLARRPGRGAPPAPPEPVTALMPVFLLGYGAAGSDWQVSWNDACDLSIRLDRRLAAAGPVAYWVRAVPGVARGDRSTLRPAGQLSERDLRRPDAHLDLDQGLARLRNAVYADLGALRREPVRLARPVVVILAIDVPVADPISAAAYQRLTAAASVVWVVPARCDSLLPRVFRDGAAVLTFHEGAAEDIASLLSATATAAPPEPEAAGGRVPAAGDREGVGRTGRQHVHPGGASGPGPQSWARGSLGGPGSGEGDGHVTRAPQPPGAAGARRILRATWVRTAAWLVPTGAVTYVVAWWDAEPSSLAVPVAVYVTAAIQLTMFMFLIPWYRPYQRRPAWHLATGVVAGTAAGTLFLSLDREALHFSAPVSVAMGMVAGLIFANRIVIQSRRLDQHMLTGRVRDPGSRADAWATFAASQRAMTDRRTSADGAEVATLNKILAARILSRGDDAPDGLVQAAWELPRLFRNSQLGQPASLGLRVANERYELEAARAVKHGDVAGLPAALEYLVETASRLPPDPDVMALVHLRRVDYHGLMASQAPTVLDAEEHVRLQIAELRAAIAATSPRRRSLLVQMKAGLGMLIAAQSEDPVDRASGTEMCRDALRLAGWRPSARALPQLMLAISLMNEAVAMDGDAVGEASGSAAARPQASRVLLTEAEGLLVRAQRHLGTELDRETAAGTLAAVRSMALDEPAEYPHTARSWREAARAAEHGDPLSRLDIGLWWATWAEGTEDASYCAEAYAYLMSLVARVVAVRYLAAERDRVLARLTSAAEEAGYWLARNGQSGAAAVALELGRAVSLTEILGRDQPGLAVTLTRAGRPDLLARYRAALDQYRAIAPEPARGPGSAARAAAAQAAWSAYDTVIREIAAAIGVEMPGTPPTPAELASAAHDGPVVYLAGAGHGGYAIVVSAAGEPTCYPLPGLARDRIAAQARAFLDDASPDAVTAVIQWLWENGIRDLSRVLPAGTLVTIIAAGLLALLPVHAAGGPVAPGQAPADWEYLADRVIVRYAHNARTLLHARHQVAWLPPSAQSLLAIGAPDGGLPFSRTEAEQVARQWSRGAVVSDGTPAEVARMLADRNVWHVACHCQVTPDSIADSALLLAGGPVTLRDLLALPPAPRRLAVLSGCDTQLSGTTLPDEAVGLPAGLLQAGFAGVVAAHWPVRDQATAALMIRFHRLWHGQGCPPAAALAQAQRWLRTATTQDVHACLAGKPDPPGPRPGAPRPLPRYPHPYYWAGFALTGQ